MNELCNGDISAAEEAYLVQRCDEINLLAEGREVGESQAPLGPWPIVFLDFDDVLCTNSHFGGLDALEAVMGQRIDERDVYARLWAPRAVNSLRGVHEKYEGKLRYVISSTWRLHFNRAQLRATMYRSGLGFVADCLEVAERWATPDLPLLNRAKEVLTWLEMHHAGEPFVILDDAWSGSSFRAKAGPTAERFAQRVVFCRVDVGMGPVHIPRAIAALGRPCPIKM